MMTGHVYTITQINQYLKNLFQQDFVLQQVSLEGEVSNCKYHSSGHIYFTLKDKKSAIRAILFAGNRKGLDFRMKDGDNVVVTGSIEVYERDGTYQLYARKVELQGLGDLYVQFEARKRELAEMGMFAPEYKRPIPRFARTIGVVTAPTGAAIQDIQNIAHRRNPYVRIILYPALVQGEGAAQSIVNGIHALEMQKVDVIIVGRGGGSIEDLWAFNEEIVARAIFECGIPIISAVGHETDTTISDYVADLRAPTPSAAAEQAVFDYWLFQEQLIARKKVLQKLLLQHLQNEKKRLLSYQMQLQLKDPVYQLKEKQQKVIRQQEKLEQRMQQILSRQKHRLEVYAGRLDGLSPLKKLNQGYAVVTDKEQRSVKRITQVSAGDPVTIQVEDGKIYATVDRTEERMRMDDGRKDIRGTV